MDQELIVFVDKKGKPTGETGPKLASHHAHTRLHLAFSCYIFDKTGAFLVTQRALSKKVWPGVWTNSVCGHPGPGEDMLAAIRRRLDYELGMTAGSFELVLSDYTYKTPPYNGIIEHEFCPVYLARATSQVRPNADEVEDFKWIAWGDYVERAEADTADVWSWWCKDQLKRLKVHPALSQFTKVY